MLYCSHFFLHVCYFVLEVLVVPKLGEFYCMRKRRGVITEQGWPKCRKPMRNHACRLRERLYAFITDGVLVCSRSWGVISEEQRYTDTPVLNGMVWFPSVRLK